MHEGASSGIKPSRSTSLQGYVPAEMTYSSGDMIIALQEVLSRSLQFHNGVYSELPDSIKYILDNLYTAFTRNNHSLFEKTLQALEIHLVNLTAQNEAYINHYANLISEKILASENDLVSNLVLGNIFILENEAFRSHLVDHPNITIDSYISQLFGKEDIHSKDKMTIMGADYAKLSLKTQSMIRSAFANLPSDIQSRILRSKAMFRSFDL